MDVNERKKNQENNRTWSKKVREMLLEKEKLQWISKH